MSVLQLAITSLDVLASHLTHRKTQSESIRLQIL